MKKKFAIISCLAVLLLAGISAGSQAQTHNQEEELFLIAQKAFDDGFYDVALRYITQFIQTYPQSPRLTQVQLLHGQCYFFKNQYLKAYDIFQSLLTAPDHRDATLFWLGETYFKGSDYAQAQARYEELLNTYPQSEYRSQAIYALGWTYMERGEYPAAKEQFKKITESSLDSPLKEEAAFLTNECIYNQGDYATAIDVFQDYLNRYPQGTHRPQALFYIAEAYYYQNNFLDAIAFYARAAEISLDKKMTFNCHVSMGWSYLKLEKYDLAENSFRAALSLAETDQSFLTEDVFLGQASLFTSREEYALAREAYQRLLEQFPNSPRIFESRLGLANADYMLKNYPTAITEYQAIINDLQATDNHADILEKAHYGLAWTYLKSGDSASSIKIFEQIANQTKNDAVKVNALVQLADVYHDTDQFEKAIEIYDRILRDYPDSLPADYAQFRQGIALLKLNRIEAATLSFLSLRTNFPGSKYLVDTYYYLGVAYFRKGDWSQCLRNISEYLASVSPQNEFANEATYMLGIAQFNLKNFASAQSLFQKLIQEGAKDPAIVRISEFYLAKCFYQLNQYAEAIKAFESVVNKYPDTDTAQEALLWLADHYLEKNEPTKASSYYLQFIEKFPSSPRIHMLHYQLGQIYQGQRQFDLAIQQYQAIPDSDRDLFGKSRLAIADIFVQETDGANAIDTYHKIATTSPEYRRDALMKIATIFEKNKEMDRAIETLQKALQSPQAASQIKDAELQFAIADAYEISHNVDQAVDVFFKIPYLYPKETTWVVKAYLRIARIFENAEKWEEAQTTYQKIVDLSVEESKYALERIQWIQANVFKKP